jgi:hypothetical protein
MTQSSLRTQNIKIYLQDIYAKKLRDIEIFVNNIKSKHSKRPRRIFRGCFLGENDVL